MERLAHSVPFAIAAVGQGVLFLLLLVSARTSRTSILLCCACAATAAATTALCFGVPNRFGIIGAVIELALTGTWCAFAIWLLQQQGFNPAHFRRIISAGALLCAVLNVGGAVFLEKGGGFLEQGGGLSPSLIRAVELYSRIGLAVVGLLATENFYRNTNASRWNIDFLCIALIGLFGYTVFVYADALLFGRVSPLFWAGRGIVIGVAAPLLAIAAARNRDWSIDIHVSRNAVFHSATLVGSGLFLLALAAAGEVFRSVGPGWGDVAELSLVIAGSTAAAVVVSSGGARSRLRRFVADHFYSTRYDYRQEWLKSIETLSGGQRPDSVQTRVIKAITEVADSPRGVLWVRDQDGLAFTWAGSWNQPGISVAEPADSDFVRLFRAGGWIVEIEDVIPKPKWFEQIIDPWLAVPLCDKGQLIGYAVVSRPRAPLKLDAESFDLLRIVARQAAVHVAEQRNARALAESRDLREFAKRFAFVAHDIKNVSSQLAMILHNARSHGDDPEFHKDVLATVQAAHQRIGKLLSGLRKHQGEPVPRAILPVEIIREKVGAIRRLRGDGIIRLHEDGRDAAVSMDPDDFEAVITHLCDNAIEASAGEVEVRVRHEPMRVEIDVADRGDGMTAEFVRDQLFQPFGSTKREGMGIGAYQARELLRAVGGDLLVMSQPGAGTTMRLLLPALGGTLRASYLQPKLEGIHE